MHRAERLALESNPSELEIATEKLEGCDSPGIDQSPAQLIQAGGNTIYYVLRSTKELILFGIRKNSIGRSVLLYLYMKMVIKLTVSVLEGYNC
jgi:hypothetical protein